MAAHSVPAQPKAASAPPAVVAGEPASEAEEKVVQPRLKGYVQIGDITPVDEAQRKDDMDDIMKAVMELERESSFSSGKERPNMQIYDKEGNAVDNEGLLKKDTIELPAQTTESTLEVEALAEKILGVYEKQEIVNGGVMQLKKLKSLLDQEAGRIIDTGKLAATLEVVQSMGMISKIIDLPGNDKLLIFKEIELPADEVGIIQLAISTPIAEFTKDNIVAMLGIPEEVVLATLKRLQDKGIIRFSGNSIQVPGVMQ
ncbi:MAG: winged helix-turn-helix domain-containing protein [Candidatus Lokiarchaeota archaeon]|nr:winged helix-turn-helix domain-containing protein [Candidatus Lokiarchaeota archaeon]